MAQTVNILTGIHEILWSRTLFNKCEKKYNDDPTQSKWWQLHLFDTDICHIECEREAWCSFTDSLSHCFSLNASKTHYLSWNWTHFNSCIDTWLSGQADGTFLINLHLLKALHKFWYQCPLVILFLCDKQGLTSCYSLALIM